MPSSVNLDNRYGAENDIVYKRLLRDNIIFERLAAPTSNMQQFVRTMLNVEYILSDVCWFGCGPTHARARGPRREGEAEMMHSTPRARPLSGRDSRVTIPPRARSY